MKHLSQLVIVVGILATFMIHNSASGFECRGAKLPSSIVICSDPELISLADERQQAFNEVRWGKSGDDLLDPDRDKELWLNQRAWVRDYATSCGVPPDRSPKLPISESIKECFKQAARTRIAFLQDYRRRPIVADPSYSRARWAGPGFDCFDAKRPLALLICADPDLAKADLLFNQAYWALYHHLDDAGKRKLKDEDVDFLETMKLWCELPQTGSLNAQTWRSYDCVKGAYEKQRSAWIARLSGAALEEATRPIQSHISIERRLRQLALLKTPPIPEGVYGPAVRDAIMTWQKMNGKPQTGFINQADTVALQRNDKEGVKPAPRNDEQAARPPTVPPSVAPSPTPPPKVSEASSGTAFVINGGSDFLTNFHVIKGCTSVTVRVGSSSEKATVVASDEKNDLAVIRARGIKVPVLKFREGKAIRPADGVIGLGFPYAGLLTTSLQVTTGVVSALAGIQDDTRYLQLTAPVQPGNSGGPLLDLSGNVVGVVSGRLNALLLAEATGSLPQNVNFAIKSGIVTGFLEANGVQWGAMQSTMRLDPADVGETAAKSVAFVQCYK